jgi:hypothetical protein
MGFQASRAALRFGYTATREWLASENGAALLPDFPRTVAPA